MLKKHENRTYLFQIISFLFVLLAIAKIDAATAVPRISIQTYIQGTILPVYLTPGRSSVIDFPCQVTKASGGTGGDLHVSLATTIGNEVDLSLDSSASQPTSLIVRCKETVFIFDIIPSKKNHQEYVKIKQMRGAIKYYSTQNADQEGNNTAILDNGKTTNTASKYDTSKLQKLNSGRIFNN